MTQVGRVGLVAGTQQIGHGSVQHTQRGALRPQQVAQQGPEFEPGTAACRRLVGRRDDVGEMPLVHSCLPPPRPGFTTSGDVGS